MHGLEVCTALTPGTAAVIAAPHKDLYNDRLRPR